MSATEDSLFFAIEMGRHYYYYYTAVNVLAFHNSIYAQLQAYILEYLRE